MNIFNDDFDQWISKKREINSKLIENISFNEREIWWCSVGRNIGSEINGKNDNFERPILIFRIFGPDTLWAIPLTTRPMIKESRKEHEFTFNGIIQTIDISQLRLISAKRLLRCEGIISYCDFQQIRRIFKDLY